MAQDLVLISCRIPRHSTKQDHPARSEALRELFRLVSTFIDRNDPESILWFPIEGGGQLCLDRLDWTGMAIDLLGELRDWSAGVRVPLHVSAHLGPIERLEGPLGQEVLVGRGLSDAEDLLGLGGTDRVVVSEPFREAMDMNAIQSVDLHDELLVRTPSGLPMRVSLLSVADRFRSAWGTATRDDLSLLIEAAREKRAWDVVFHAKRLLQLNANHQDAILALEQLRDRDLTHHDSGTGDELINRILGLMDRHSRVEFIKAVQLVECDVGDLICRANEDGDTMFLILKGEVGVFTQVARGPFGSLSPRPAFRLGPGQIVGELAYALHRPRTATLQCLSRTSLLSFNYPQLKALLRDSPFRNQIEGCMEQFLHERILEYVCNNISYFVGKDRSGPLAKVTEPWVYLRSRTTIFHCHWQELAVVSRNDARFSDPGIYLLVSGQVQDVVNPAYRLHGNDLPIIYADIPGYLIGNNSKYMIEEDAKFIRISPEAFLAPYFDRRTFIGMVEAMKRALSDQGTRAIPSVSTDEAFSAQTILIHFPTPIALAYQRFCQQRESIRRLDRLFKTVEVTIKYLTFLGLSDLFNCLSRPDRTSGNLPSHPAFDFLRHPVPMTLGRWVEALRETCRALSKEPDHLIKELPTVCRPGGHIDVNILGWIVANRNLFEHPPGSLPMREQECRELVGKVRSRLEEALQHLSFLCSYPLGFVTKGMTQKNHEITSRYYLHSCMGVRISDINEAFGVTTNLKFATNIPFIIARERSKLLYLWPWLFQEVGEHTGSHTLFAFEQIAKNGQFLSIIKLAALDQQVGSEKTLHSGRGTDHSSLYQALRELPSELPLSGEERIFEGLLPSRGGMLIGKTLGSNRVIAVIARGGSSTVYAAEGSDGRRIAIKVLEHRERFQHYPRFKEEFEKLQSARHHPGIIRCYELDTSLIDGREYPWYSMEFALGGDLSSRIRERGNGSYGPLPWNDPVWRSDIIHEFRTLASAAAHLHELDIIHRDIKPGNVLLMEDGEVKLSDFGLVKALNRRPDDLERPNTSTGAVLGTHRYMSPEQAHGVPVGKSTDVYSLGVLLAEAALGQYPDPELHVPQGSTLHNCLLLTQLPDLLQKIIYKCTDVNPAKRQSDAQEVCAEFAQINE